MPEQRFEPWFGTWPPEFRGEETKMDKDKWFRWMPYIAFLFVFLVGVLVVFAVSMWWDSGLWGQVFLGVGIALITAGIIGIIIELAFITKLAKHVFEVAFGYILPPELREEVKWVFGLERIAEESRHIFTITRHPTSKDKVIMNEEFTREVKNITNKSRQETFGIGIQEWFHPEGDSRIKSLTVTYGKKRWSIENEKVRLSKRGKPPILQAEITETFDVKPRETFSVVTEIEEIKYENDQTYSYYGTALKNPYVTVRVPKDMDYDVTFANRNQGELQDLGNNVYRLNGTLLPLQAIRIRWWRIADNEKWLKEKLG